jgi:hypothetical protein
LLTPPAVANNPVPVPTAIENVPLKLTDTLPPISPFPPETVPLNEAFGL